MDRAYAQKYAALEASHWWFRARRIILADLLRREVSWRPGMSVLEIGVGPGLNLYSLYPEDCRLHGLEPDEENASIASKRGSVPVSVGTVEQLPESLQRQSFDVITMFDVLEHIEDDLNGLQIVNDRLAENGVLVLTVPAHQWLWSHHDVINHHFRRYSRKQLVEVLKQAGFRVQRATYFNFLLLPLVMGARILERVLPHKTAENKTDFEKSSGFLDQVLFRIFSAEASWLRTRGFPSGVSLFAVARK